MILSFITLSAQWQLTGNAGTNPSIHFIGTTNDKPLKFRTNNLPMGHLSQYSIFFGYNAGVQRTSNYNVGIGWNALSANTNGSTNTAIGSGSLYLNTTGSQNTATGYLSLQNNTTGQRNTAIGEQTLFFNTTGNTNTALGISALNGNSTGYSNTAVGTSAGFWNEYRHKINLAFPGDISEIKDTYL